MKRSVKQDGDEMTYGSNRNQFEMLDRMVADMADAPPIYQPTQFWRKAARTIADELRAKNVSNFRRLDSPLMYFVPTFGFPGWWDSPEKYAAVLRELQPLVVEDPRLLTRTRRFLSGFEDACADYRVFLASCDDKPLHIAKASESMVGNPSEQHEFGGARFSRSMLNYLLGLCFLKRHVNTADIKVVMEIGGGFGSLGEILHCDPRNGCFYLDVDIPPPAFAATYYLQGVLGGKNVGDYNELAPQGSIEMGDLRRRFKAAVICPWQLPKVSGSVDLFVNFISFQEMEPEVVKHYLDHVDRLQTRFVLLRNLREGKQKAKNPDDVGVREPIRGVDYDAFLPNYRLAATNTEPFGYKTPDGFHSELRLYARC